MAEGGVAICWASASIFGSECESERVLMLKLKFLRGAGLWVCSLKALFEQAL